MINFLLSLFIKIFKLVKQRLQPPIVASILAMVLGIGPLLKRWMFPSDAPRFFLNRLLRHWLRHSGQSIPCILLALGGNLVDGPASSKLGVRTTVAIIFARLVWCLLQPPVGLDSGILMLIDKFGFLPVGDAMFRFVTLL